jgi:hypothetical protein
MSDHTSKTDVEMGSERSFGIVFAVVFGIIGAWPLLGGGDIRIWAMAIAAGFLLTAFLRPSVLKPLNKIWFAFGMLLHKIISPIVMGILFFLTVTPIAMLLKLFGKDPLTKKFDPDMDSYWIKIDPAKAAANSMRNQF